MHPERALSVINLVDAPESKRKYWPQESCVIIDSENREILDVIQFYSNSFSESEKYQRLYPNSIAFFVNAGELQNLKELREKIVWCFTDPDNTYVLGKGQINKKG